VVAKLEDARAASKRNRLKDQALTRLGATAGFVIGIDPFPGRKKFDSDTDPDSDTDF
jgi:hypothetical protein